MQRTELVRDDVLRNALGDVSSVNYVNSICADTLKDTDYLETDSKKDRRIREMFRLNFYWFMQTLIDIRDVKENKGKLRYLTIVPVHNAVLYYKE